MLDKPSLLTRIIVGKFVGFLVGLAGFLMMPVLWPEADGMLRWGILLWYTTLGAVIGMAGVFSWHPVLKLPMPWWIRSSGLGAWMNFVLMLFAHEKMRGLLVTLFGENGALTSPFWFVAEGALIGLLIGFLATRFGGEGAELAIPEKPG